MSEEIKNDWKETGKELGSAFKDLGKTLIKTAKIGVDKAVDWADGETPAPKPVICSGCGAQNPQGSKFCSGCGKPLSQ